MTEVISPELVLVCPDLRAAAIAALPDRDPDASLRQPRLAATTPPEYELMAALLAEETSLDEMATSLPVALLAYTATSAVRFTMEAAAFMAVVIGLLSVFTLVHS